MPVRLGRTYLGAYQPRARRESDDGRNVTEDAPGR